jgi:hypothetical protein
MWFGIVFAVLVEIVPLEVRSTTVGVFLFVMNNVGGNLPILVDPVAKMIGFRESISIFYAGFYFLSAFLFFATMFFMDGPKPEVVKPTTGPANGEIKLHGHENSVFSTADETLPQNGYGRPAAMRPNESSRL